MTLLEMFANLLEMKNQNVLLRETVFHKIPMPIQRALAEHGIDPGAFAAGMNSILQLIAGQGLPEDWEAIVHPTPADPAKVSEVVLTEEDGPAVASEVEEFMMAWMKFKKQGPENPPRPTRNATEESGF